MWTGESPYLENTVSALFPLAQVFCIQQGSFDHADMLLFNVYQMLSRQLLQIPVVITSCNLGFQLQLKMLS